MKYYKHRSAKEYYRVYDDNTYEFLCTSLAGMSSQCNAFYRKWHKGSLLDFYKRFEPSEVIAISKEEFFMEIL